MNKNVLTSSVVVVGCVIGAGFASGREMMLFFGNAGLSPALIALLFFLLFFGVTLLFFSLGRMLQVSNLRDLNGFLLGKRGFVLDILFVVQYFLVLVTMTAGLQSVFDGATGTNGFPFFSLVLVFFCGGVVCFGMNGVKKVSIAVVPIIVLFVVIVTVPALSFSGIASSGGVGSSVRYVGYNSLLMCGVVCNCGKTMTKKQASMSAFLSAFLLACLVFLVLSALSTSGFGNADMPMLALSRSQGVGFWFFASVLLFSILTTLLSALQPLVALAQLRFDKHLSIVFLLGSSFLVSMLGFRQIFDNTTPIVTVVALMFLALCVLRVVSRSISSASFATLPRRGTSSQPANKAKSCMPSQGPSAKLDHHKQ